MRLSANFTVAEFTKSATADRLGVNNAPDVDSLANLRRLALDLEKVRAITGKPLKIHSGYRSPEVNAAVGGSPKSYHMVGCAADIQAPVGWTNDQLQHAIHDTAAIDFDMVLEERTKTGVSWLHVQISRDGKPGRRLIKDAELDRVGGAITRVSVG